MIQTMTVTQRTAAQIVPVSASADPPASGGGFAGIPCPAGQVCEDDPKKGDADCPGICVV
jgi:hypothetical protein